MITPENINKKGALPIAIGSMLLALTLAHEVADLFGAHDQLSELAARRWDTMLDTTSVLGFVLVLLGILRRIN